jgi:hypothetical protein
MPEKTVSKTNLTPEGECKQLIAMAPLYDFLLRLIRLKASHLCISIENPEAGCNDCIATQKLNTMWFPPFSG